MLNNNRRLVIAATILPWMVFHVWLLHQWFSIDFSLAVWDSVVSNILLVASSLVLVNTLMHYIPHHGRFWFALGFSFLLAYLCQRLTLEVLIQAGKDDAYYLNFLSQAVPVRWSAGFLVIACTSVSSVFYYQLKEQVELKKRETDAETMVREAELQKLQMQLQPHFLFNCLNSINAMILLQPEEARKMVQQLSEFLRLTLKRSDEHWVTLEEEWHYLQLYLGIEKIRFGHRLVINTYFSDDTHKWTIPTLLLQPLVENAIKFGLYGTTRNVTIELKAFVKKELLHIQVSNPFDADMHPPTGSGFGVSGLQRRLYLLYARNDLLQTHITDHVFTAELKIPLQK